MRNDPARQAIIVATAIGALCAGAATAQTFEFTINPQASGLLANIGFDAQSSGTLVGDWSDANPGGTGTKPGLRGGFADSENIPVGVALGLSLAGDVEGATAGSFRLELDADEGSLKIENFAADLLAGQTAALPALVSVEPDGFRTRQPESAYAGAPLEVPAGEFLLTGLSLVQTTGPVRGMLTELEPGRYGFTVVAPAVLEAAVDLNGWPVQIATPTELALTGEVAVRGGVATLTGMHRIDHAELQHPAVQLPRFPVELPTMLPGGETSRVTMELTLDELASSLMGRLALSAEGAVGGCVPDFNGDSAVNTLDFIAYIANWNARDDIADVNRDGTVNSRDLLHYLDEWTQGC